MSRLRPVAVCAMALLLGGALAFPAVAATSSGDAAGQYELKMLISLMRGSVGLFLGLVVTLLGLWAIVVKQDSKGGVLLLIIGPLISMFPAFYSGVRVVVCPIAEQLGASSSYCSGMSIPGSSITGTGSGGGGGGGGSMDGDYSNDEPVSDNDGTISI